MNREELRGYVGVTAYSMGQVEKDYLQHILLGALSRRLGGALVFKGGTALQKIGVIQRFSEDLDFTAREPISYTQLEEVSVNALKAFNFPPTVDRPVDDERTIGFRVKVQGPLYRGPKTYCSITLEISRREEVVRQPTSREIAPPYRDVLPYLLLTMDMEEMLAEKIRTLATRQKARDLYDVTWLERKGFMLDASLVERKLDIYEMPFDRTHVHERALALEAGWDAELSDLVEVVPPYREALDALDRLLAHGAV
jgi:predicted nucleotidyltransferase component of viral defense system